MKTLYLYLCIVLVSLVSYAVGYTVVGNKIYDPNGVQVILRGLDRPSLEWNTAGEQISLADYTLMKNWGSKVNVIRISLTSQYWVNDVNGYKARIQQQVDWIRGLGLGVIFDLHWNDDVRKQQNMGDRSSITFWSQFAAAYKNNKWVIFELYNEPHDISWSVWRNGDSSYAGMQEMLDAVRAAGATNLVIACGLNWAYDLSGIPAYALTGSHVAYGSHPYDYGGKQPSDWDYGFGNLAATYPVILTEFGQYCNANSYVQTLLQYSEGKGIHWTGWAWYVQGCGFPSLIDNWSGTPSTVGAIVKSFLGTSTSTTGSSSSSSTTGSSSTPAPGGLQLYTESLGTGFEDWSWGTHTIGDTTRARTGSKSIKFQAQSYEAIYLRTSSNRFTLSTYNKITFYVYSTSYIAASNFATLLYSNDAKVGSDVTFNNALSANAWTAITAQLTSFGVSSSTLVSGVAIQVKTSSNIGPVWIDDWSVVV